MHAVLSCAVLQSLAVLQEIEICLLVARRREGSADVFLNVWYACQVCFCHSGVLQRAREKCSFFHRFRMYFSFHVPFCCVAYYLSCTVVGIFSSQRGAEIRSPLAPIEAPPSQEVLEQQASSRARAQPVERKLKLGKQRQCVGFHRALCTCVAILTVEDVDSHGL